MSHASGTTTQVLPKLEIPASRTIQIQSTNQSLTNAAQVCIDSMPLTEVDVRTHSHVLNSLTLTHYYDLIPSILSDFVFFSFEFFYFADL